MKKMVVVITSRPSYSRIKSVLTEIKKNNNFKLYIIATASCLLKRYGKTVDIIRDDGFNVDETVYMLVEGENPTTMAKTVGLGIIELATIFDNIKPDMVLTIADRYETMSTVIAASCLNIPIVHIQGGELTGSIDEKIRHAITKFSSLHFVSNNKCEERLTKMGENPNTIYVTGCPSIDLARLVNESKPITNEDFYKRYIDVIIDRNPLDIDKDFIIVLQHSVTTEHEESYNQIYQTLLAVSELDIQVLVLYPNVDAGANNITSAIQTFRNKLKPKNMYYFINFIPEDFLSLLIKSKCIVGNSSVGIREASYLGVPCVNVGNRQKNRDRAKNVIDVDYNKKDIKDAIMKQIKHGKYKSSTIYGDGYAGNLISEILDKVEPSIEKEFYENNS